jgi:hypothetical protein
MPMKGGTELQAPVEVSANIGGAARSGGGYSLSHLSLRGGDPQLLSDWKAFLVRSGSNTPMHDPEWLRTQFADQLDDVSVYLVYQSGSLCGVAPVACGDWPMKWQVGEVTLAQLPLKRLRVVGGAPAFPDDESAWDLLFRELASRGSSLDAIYFEAIPIDSFLWKYLQSSPLVRRSFRGYIPQQPSRHYLLRLGESFTEYMSRFSSKHRKNLLREVRIIKEGALGQAEFKCYTKPEQVAEFIDLAGAVSKKTWQWNLLGGGVSDPGMRKRLMNESAHGWLRSYVLVCDKQPTAYIVGFQYGDRFIFQEFGFDPAYSKYSVGTVSFVMMIEDLFVHHRARIMDLGGTGKYKESFTTESFLDGSIFLFKRGTYTTLVQAGHWMCQLGSTAGSAVLNKLKMREKVRKKIREASLR